MSTWEQRHRREVSGTAVSQDCEETLSGALWRTGGPWSLPVHPVLRHQARALSGERTHVCESGLSGSTGEAGKTGRVCVHPCGPHLRESGKHREGVTPRTPAP